MPSDPQYERYERQLAARQTARMRANLAPSSGASYRSLLLRSPRSRVTRTSPARSRRGRRPEPQPWVEHVRDGVALTEHGARLLEGYGVG